MADFTNSHDGAEEGLMRILVLRTGEHISYANCGRSCRISYFRDKAGHEVDMLLEENGRLYPIEVKLSGTPSLDDLAAVRHIPTGRLKLGGGVIICNIPKPLPLGFDNIALPISAI